VIQVPLPPAQLRLANRQRELTEEAVCQDQANQDKDPGEAMVTTTAIALQDLMKQDPGTLSSLGDATI
jgi:hypothetical protein